MGGTTSGDKLTLAIQPDHHRHRNGEVQSFSERWRLLCERDGIQARVVDVFAPDFFAQLAGCAGFMWRFGYAPVPRNLARRLLPAVEHGMGIPVFPSWKTAWHFEDKIAQAYLLEAAGIPGPRTWVFWNAHEALAFCRAARYPLVLKLSQGYQSMNVRLLRSADDAAYWIERMFGTGLSRFMPRASPLRRVLQRPARAVRALAGGNPWRDVDPAELQHGYLYVQEFLPDNEFDTRVTIIGDRAFAFRRYNRPGDFRASGSGRIDWNPAGIDMQTVRLAFRVAHRLQTQSVAVDGLRRGEERVIAEISYTYASWAVRDCPGHWRRRDEAASDLEWVEGPRMPEDAIFEDFVSEVRRAAPHVRAKESRVPGPALGLAVGN
jgi:hypothetical protein